MHYTKTHGDCKKRRTANHDCSDTIGWCSLANRNTMTHDNSKCGWVGCNQFFNSGERRGRSGKSPAFRPWDESEALPVLEKQAEDPSLSREGMNAVRFFSLPIAIYTLGYI